MLTNTTLLRRQAPSMSERALALRDLFAAQGADNEAAGELSETTVSTLYDNGFFSMFVPQTLGGAEVSPTEALEVIETLCSADASTGWVVMATQLATGAAGAFLAESAVEELFRRSGRHAIIAGQGAPNGRALVVPGGYRLSGRWSYGSGLKHADHIHTGAWVFEGDRQRLMPGTSNPERRIFIVPKSEAQLGDNWDVIGLRATGSIDYVLDDVSSPTSGPTTRPRRQPRAAARSTASDNSVWVPSGTPPLPLAWPAGYSTNCVSLRSASRCALE